MNVGKFILNIVVAFIAFGILYTVGPMMFADAFEASMMALKPQEETVVPIMGYHLVQTIAFVWLFGKAVGSADLKAGAMFGFMVGLYLLATDNIWYTMLKDFPQETRLPLDIMHLVFGAIVGALMSFMWGKGMGFGAGEAAAD
ncbi:hypothetical protein ACFO5Q_14030 [Kordiimonas lipolytica]|uniref:DUF4383 domain-containing protein n=1 Tax=Kordiimonas lipolytica TaxID=1662421 RepID=A0ABV8UCM4_9PROT|nr:hypothetical protein [Kordiimonas lipolytica]